MKSFRLGLITLVAALIAGTVGAFAASAQVTSNTQLFSGPDATQVIGQMSAGEVVQVYDCSGGYCQVQGMRGQAGWISSGAFVVLDQPQPAPQPVPLPQPIPQPQPVPLPHPQPWPQPHPQPWPQPQPPKPQPPVYDEAGACFYSERDFGGYSFCLDEGDSYNRLRNWNDRIRSVEVFGGARVDLCSGENLYGSCITLRSDASRLPSQLDRRASSVDVY